MKVRPRFGRGRNFFPGSQRGEHGGLAIPFIGIDSVINVKPEAEGEEGRVHGETLGAANYLLPRFYHFPPSAAH